MTTYAEMMQMCRLCLVKEQVNLPIFDGQGEVQQIFLKITACLPVKVSREDNLPKNICDGCSYKLDLLYQFWNTSSNSEKQLIDWLTAAGVEPKQKSNEPIGLATQPNVILKQEPVTDLDARSSDAIDAISSDTQNYIIQQQQLAYKPEEYDESQQNLSNSTKKKAAADPNDESVSKRPRRSSSYVSTVKDYEDDSDEDYVDNTDAGIAKTEDESEEDDDDEDEDLEDEGDDMADPDFVAKEEEEDSQQPGPSGTKTTSGPSTIPDNLASYKKQYGLKDCIVFLGETCDFDIKRYRFMKTQAYCDVDQTNIIPTSRLKYKCEYCTAKFRDRFKMELHMEEMHADDGASSVNSVSSEEVNEPEKDDADGDFDVEKEESKGTVGIKVELKQSVNNDQCNVLALEKIMKAMKCSKCLKVFKTKRELATHFKNVHNVIACMLCTQLFYSKANFDAHTQRVHYNALGKWRCNPCGISFNEYYHLIEHNFAKHKPTCQLCKKDFPDLQSLIQHKVLRHSLPENIICKECGMTANDPKSLREHMLLHVCFNCELCDESLTSEKLYIDHVKTKHVGKEPSPRVLNNSKKYPSIKMKFTKNQTNTDSGQNKVCSYVVSQPSTSGTAITPGTSMPTATSGTTNSFKVPIPKLNSLKPTLLKTVVNSQIVPTSLPQPIVGNKDQTKILVVDKNTNKAYLIPAYMLQQNGQMRLPVPERTIGEPLLLNDSALSPTAVVSNIIQPTIGSVMQPMIPNIIQPTVNNIVQPTIMTVVQPTNTMVQQSMAPTFVMSSMHHTTNTLQNSVTVNISNAMPNKTIPSSTPVSNAGATIPKKIIIPRLPKGVVKQYRSKIKQRVTANITTRPTSIQSTISALPSSFVLSDARTEASKNDGDSEMPRLEMQPLQKAPILAAALENGKSTNSGAHATSDTPPILMPEVEDPAAPRPKIFLKPLSQLLEKPKTKVNLTVKPSTSQNVLTRITPDKVPEHIRKVSQQIKTTNENSSISSATALTKESVVENKNKQFHKCNICSAVFNRLAQLQNHKTKMKCKLCSYTVCKLKELDIHYRVVHDYQNQCVTCDLRFSTSENLKDHNRNVHFCAKCHKLYPSLEKHFSSNVCKKCDQFLCSAKDLTDHYNNVHNINHYCPPCKTIFSNDQSLKEHKKQVHFCDKCQSYKMDLSRHHKFCKGDHNYSEDTT